ncbi:MAG: hypothetical protein HGA45_11245 [Chloroflexales bacterium]|nr:hypothetical protein [Chloroflexales bacterium]
MRRRQFLGLMAALAAAGAVWPAARRLAAAADRLTWWKPATPSSDIAHGNFVALEWRYLAGRITTDADDFGYVVSLADYNPPPLFSSPDFQELLVMRQGFTGAQAHATSTYRGALSYDSATATYSFVAEDDPAVSVIWGLDTTAQRYRLTVTSPELALTDLLITPQGQLIAEGGDGAISSGNITVSGVPFEAFSDYYADWAEVSSSGGTPLGLARLDMQTIKPVPGGSGGDFSHHWFCLACTLADGTAAWLSAWQIVSGASTVWGATLGSGRGATWAVTSWTETAFTGSQPLSVQILDWQSIPGTNPTRRTGRRWRIQQGQAAAGDTLDIEIAVPPGQFIKGARISTASSIPMQEAVGPSASGSIGGKAITAIAFAAAESTYHEAEPDTIPMRQTYLPSVVT